MTIQPQPPATPPEPSDIGKGLGCFFGGLAVVASSLIGSLIVGLLSAASNSIDGSGPLTGIIGLLSVVLPIGLLIAAGVKWKSIPGFLLGIGLTIAIVMVLFTACVALVIYSLNSSGF